MLFELGVFISVSIVLLYVWLTWNYNHWKNLGIPYLEPSLIFGNVKDFVMMKKCKGLAYNDLYWQSDEPVLGIYSMRKPQLLIRDPALFKIITVNEFHSFQDNDLYTEPTDFFHSTHLFFLKGDKWKPTRARVTPALTIGKLKMYFPQIMTACRDMIEYLNENSEKEFNAKQVCALSCTDVAMGSVYGLSSNSFKDPDTKYWSALNDIINPGLWVYLKYLLSSMVPPVGHFFQIGITPKRCIDFYTEIVREAVHYRKSNNVRRNDFLQYIMDASGKDGQEYTIFEITGFTLNVIADASETVSAVMSLIIEVLLRYPEEKKKLTEEIDKTFASIDDITYENINAFPYINAFILETLRFRPLLPLTERVCTKDCEISYGGKLYKFKKGDKVAACTYAYHTDPKYFPEPEEFRPERFLNTADVPEFMPFGLGPRACVGRLFAMLQVKIYLCGLLKYFDLTPSRELTPEVEFDPLTLFGISIKGGVWMKVKKR